MVNMKSVRWADPPSGWKYGFPKKVPKDIAGDILNWIKEEGYPQSEIDACGEYFHIRFWDEPIVATGWEVFSDPSYYDLWAVRPIGERGFSGTAHCAHKDEAIAYSYTQNPDLLYKTNNNSEKEI